MKHLRACKADFDIYLGSYGWHRLFSRLFLVYGIWPGEWVERKCTGKSPHQPADVGKVLGAFLSSAFVHSFAGWTVHKGDITEASGEARFFAGCGLAVIVEESVKRLVMNSRRKKEGSGDKAHNLDRPYDAITGRIWWISVLSYVGRNFARGWYVLRFLLISPWDIEPTPLFGRLEFTISTQKSPIPEHQCKETDAERGTGLALGWLEKWLAFEHSITRTNQDFPRLPLSDGGCN